MIIKSWLFNQLVEEPHAEFNRIEANIEEIVNRTYWEAWTYVVYIKNRNITWISTIAELQSIENKIAEIAIKFSIPYTSKTWADNDPITRDTLNNWESVIGLADIYIDKFNLEFTGTFNVGELGLL